MMTNEFDAVSVPDTDLDQHLDSSSELSPDRDMDRDLDLDMDMDIADVSAQALTFDVLLKESWDSYLAAKSDGTTAQRSAALKAVYEQLLQSKKQEADTPTSRFAALTDAELKQEILRLLTLVAPTLALELGCEE